MIASDNARNPYVLTSEKNHCRQRCSTPAGLSMPRLQSPAISMQPWPLTAICSVLLVSLLMYTPLGLVGLRLFSMASEVYVSGTHSAAFVTCPNEKVAKDIARYEWKGNIEEDSEVLLMIKTRSSKIPALAEFVRSVHPYEVSEVISLPIDQGNPPYLKWLSDTVPE
ncbi:protein CutA isoform X2 [Ambystoma mexicanum]|uniref:protein CutA isoform X2 n=1 Tax=Ambystoma mexicanum TaxID=8296 RepID=UPI0037E7B725